MDRFDGQLYAQRKTSRWLWLVPIVTVALVVVLYNFRTNMISVSDHHEGPRREEQAVLFANHREYQTLETEDDALWDDLLTPNGGFIWQTEADGKRHVSGISMFHQLHCLQMLRAKLFQFREQALGAPDPAEPDHNGSKHSHHPIDDKHWLHCLDYLRQVSAF